MAPLTPPPSYFTWDPVKGKWQDSPTTGSIATVKQSIATLKQNNRNWPIAAPDIKIPAYAFNVSYNARHDTPERLRSTLGITEEIPLEILDSPLDNPEEAYRVPHKIVVIRNVGG